MGFSPSIPADRTPAYRKIADGLRQEIMSGQRVAGSQLPSTNELAAQWRLSPYTVHTALTRLVKEGWVERLNGTGTYVTDPGSRFVCAGIYHSGDMCSENRPEFIRQLHTALLDRFKQLGKRTYVFVDTRPPHEMNEILPILQKSLEERSIQCLVGLTLGLAAPTLERLRIPSAFISNRKISHQVTADDDDFFSQSVGRLKEQGCRSIGFICHSIPEDEVGHNLIRKFEEALRTHGVATRPDWMIRPDVELLPPNRDAYAYAAFHRLWQLPEKPDGLIVYPDILIRGLSAAVLEIGATIVPAQMKFVIHRNAHIRQFCPFPLTWAVSDEYDWADALIGAINNQFDGRPVESVLVRYKLEDNVLPLK